VLQCVAVCCSVLPCVAVCCSVLQLHVLHFHVYMHELFILFKCIYKIMYVYIHLYYKHVGNCVCTRYWDLLLTCVCLYIYLCVYLFIYIYIYKYMYIYMCVYICLYMYQYINICIHICTCMYVLYWYIYFYLNDLFLTCVHVSIDTEYVCVCEYGVATSSRLLEIIGLFCKRALQKRPTFCKRNL